MVIFTVDELMNDYDDYKVPVVVSTDGSNRYSTGALEHAIKVGREVAVVVESPTIREEDGWWLSMLKASDGLLLMGETPDRAWTNLYRTLGLEWPTDQQGRLVHYNVARFHLEEEGYVLGCAAKMLVPLDWSVN